MVARLDGTNVCPYALHDPASFMAENRRPNGLAILLHPSIAFPLKYTRFQPFPDQVYQSVWQLGRLKQSKEQSESYLHPTCD